MKNYYVLGTSDAYTESAIDILTKRLTEKKYPLYYRTPHLKEVKEKDEVVFYLAGKKSKAQNFIGQAIINSIEIPSTLSIDPDKERYIVEKYLILDNVKMFRAPVHIKSIIFQLDFIKNKSNYGVHLMGGVSKITEKDYKLIAS
jgi:predicted RNA-binding protein